MMKARSKAATTLRAKKLAAPDPVTTRLSRPLRSAFELLHFTAKKFIHFPSFPDDRGTNDAIDSKLGYVVWALAEFERSNGKGPYDTEGMRDHLVWMHHTILFEGERIIDAGDARKFPDGWRELEALRAETERSVVAALSVLASLEGLEMGDEHARPNASPRATTRRTDAEKSKVIAKRIEGDEFVRLLVFQASLRASASDLARAALAIYCEQYEEPVESHSVPCFQLALRRLSKALVVRAAGSR